MGRIVKWVIAIIGLVAAVIGILTYCKQEFNGVEGNISVSINDPVHWEAFPATVNVNITGGESSIGQYKTAVFQRNTRQDSEQENFMFEKLLTSTSDEFKGQIWYGSATEGNMQNYIVTAVVVNKDLEFKKYPIVYSLKNIDYQIIGQITITRNDAHARR